MNQTIATSLDDAPAPARRMPTHEEASALFAGTPPPVQPRDRRHTGFKVLPGDHPYLGAYCRAEFGRAVQLARSLGVDESLICLWVHNKRRITVKRCYQIEEVTRGVLTCEMLRPDLRWVRWEYNKKIVHEPNPSYIPPPPYVDPKAKERRRTRKERDHGHTED